VPQNEEQPGAIENEQTNVVENEQHDQQDSPDHSSADRMVPVSEAIRYRKRAQGAEQKMKHLQDQLEQLQNRLNEADQTIVSLERRHKIDAMLTESQVVDLETARLLTEHTVSMMDEPDIKTAVDDLRKHKPFLFHKPQSNISSTMTANVDAEHDYRLDQAAGKAINSGDRCDLLQYLRMKRSQTRQG